MFCLNLSILKGFSPLISENNYFRLVLVGFDFIMEHLGRFGSFWVVQLCLINSITFHVWRCETNSLQFVRKPNLSNRKKIKT